MKEGETSEPILSDSGLHLIYMAEVRGATQMVAQTKARHILVKSSEIMTSEQANQLVASLRARALAGEDFADLAREYSEDIGSAQEGGELGWTSPGQMVPEFEAAMRDMQVGQIKDEVVETRYGMHVLRLDARADGDVLPFEAVRARLADAAEKAAWTNAARDFVAELLDQANITGMDLRNVA